MADFFSGLVGGVVGAAAAVDVPAEGERLPRQQQGTEWGCCCSKLSDSSKELEGFLLQLSFVAGKLASCLKLGVEHLASCVAEGRVLSSSSSSSSCLCLMDKNDVQESIEAGRQGANCLLRSSKLALEALLEAAKVAAARGLILAESSKNLLLRNIPQAQDKLQQTYSQFLKGYQSSSSSSSRGLGYGSYHQQQQQQQPSSYGAPPASQQQPSSTFFWTAIASRSAAAAAAAATAAAAAAAAAAEPSCVITFLLEGRQGGAAAGLQQLQQQQ
ncbi:Refractile-body associated protein, related [Eimeria brunetti]|uniref:Refractile-body associated protein, related n=1 Tax=Eimeria brunetti TaxID=51314 RepID=U6LIF8_9EIME|nr:Refractile-body associated protein, related [Eimeria brunetti]